MSEKKKGFNLADALKNVSELDTGITAGREQIDYIDIDLLDSDTANFYELSGIDELAGNIETIGLQQPLRVRANPEAPGRYIIVSGHRRREAISKLVADGRKDLREIPCILDRQAGSTALQELRLIYANSDTRRMTSADIGKQALRVEQLLYQLKEEGFEFPVRMRDHVAEACKVSKSKLARLKVIRDDLASCWEAGYTSGDLGESVAYALAQMPRDQQRAIYVYWAGKGTPLRQLYEGTVKNYAEHLKKLEKLKCKKFDGLCRNTDAKRQKVLAAQSLQYVSCVEKCCSECADLGRCKSACPYLAEQVHKIKDDAREQRKQEKLAKEAEDRPIIQKIQNYWNRFGEARNAADVSVKAFYKACGRFYASSDDEKTVKMECLEAPFSTNTPLPYGYSCYLDEIDKLVRVADLFGCSLDYLFCRTDIPHMAQRENVPNSDTSTLHPANLVDIIPGMWYPTSVEPPLDAEIITFDKFEYVESAVWVGAGILKDSIATDWKDVVLWSLFPQKATAEKLPESPAEGWIPLQWLPGQEKPQHNTRAIAKFDMKDGYPPVEISVIWNGSGWQWKDGTIVDGQCISWFPLPPEDPQEELPRDKRCVTGLNPYGQCGAAACCAEPYPCCKDCPDPCNSQCGYLEE